MLLEIKWNKIEYKNRVWIVFLKLRIPLCVYILCVCVLSKSWSKISFSVSHSKKENILKCFKKYNKKILKIK